ncbi:bifunctional SMCs flexible hinge superfamily/Smc2 [Babesia duncani]|uniref:Structural maintenance of chromosomes protein n=1 Tax=Babesia duncani TaxID=323732 RepID=A0AAD9PNY4_9APIC|nr:bifunctional SMCs flexible hinge superfamily/Smc2 [Babesia duncani]
MHIDYIILDGFKSYSSRTTIGPLDPHFNAVTGLNGSGKSNVLDSLCFALGIADLSCVRANKLDDLIYKQGQAGITKATVTMVLNNRNQSTTLPEAYRKLPEITITRQIAIGGRNRYFINSHPSTPKAIADFFQAVGLNVNNPRFLIMQGKVTKVVNMKPKELLSLIEEASGTSIYENKRAAAVKLMTRKEQKLEEIRKILIEEIEPAMQKLKNDRDDFVNWSNAKEEAERLERFDIAYKYWKTKRFASDTSDRECMAISQKTAAQHDLEAIEEEDRNLLEKMESLRMETESGNIPLSQAQNERNNISKAISKFTSDVKILECDLREAESSAKGIRADMEIAKNKLAEMKKHSHGDIEAINALKENIEANKRTILELETELGIGTGNIGDSAGNSKQAQLKQLKTLLSKTEADESSLRNLVIHNESEMKKQREALESMGDKISKFQKMLESAEKSKSEILIQLHQASDEFENLGGDSKIAALNVSLVEAKNSHQQLCGSVASLEAQLDRCRTRCKVPQGYGIVDSNDIDAAYYGQVFDILSLRPEMSAASLAVHVLFGPRLSYMVARDKECAKAIFEANQFSHGNRKVTILPLRDAVVGRVITEADVLHCRRLSKVNVHDAHSVASYLDVLEFDPQFKKLAQYIAGNGLICSSSEIARQICYNQDRSKAFPTVTLQGDKFDVGGFMSGGSNRGVHMILQIASKLRESRAQATLAKESAENIRLELESLQAALEYKREIQGKLELCDNNLSNIKTRIEICGSNGAIKKLQELERTLQDNNMQISKLEKQHKDIEDKIKTLEAEIKDWSLNRSRNEAAARNRLKELRLNTKGDAAKLDQMTNEIAESRMLEENLQYQVTRLEQELEQRQGQISQICDKIVSVNHAISEQQDKFTKIELKLDALAAESSNRKHAMAEIQSRLESNKVKKNEITIMIRELQHKIQQMAKDSHQANAEMENLLMQHPWIAGEECNFNKQNSFFDFANHRLESVSRRLQELSQLRHDLGRRVNRKAQHLYEKTEVEYRDLLAKKHKVEADRSKIQNIIAELDVKKMENINEVFSKVNKYFSDIFHILLSNAESRLEPVNGDIKNGIEMKVGFNGTWKNSLVELSGGQRSLLALSLILAMLKVRPAPIYILDEVDAALDLSHTQNIGKMIRTQFPNSQFIIVSLKEGMFANASVLFQTRFVDGASVITRNVQGKISMALKDAQT